MRPVDIQKTSENLLKIVWDDGHDGRYEIVRLRKKCPCASCRTAVSTTDANPLRILSSNEILNDDLSINEAEVVGRYAVQFSWSDGHREGIYSFDYLRELCQCDVCIKRS
ncbi:MAG: gamma-butyrobetaine hydroxylase-like domain-containing protein [bacterium]